VQAPIAPDSTTIRARGKMGIFFIGYVFYVMEEEINGIIYFHGFGYMGKHSRKYTLPIAIHPQTCPPRSKEK
jgi:hypothetical protein